MCIVNGIIKGIWCKPTLPGEKVLDLLFATSMVENVQMIEGVTRSSSHSFSHNSPIRSGLNHWKDDMKMIFLLKTNPRHVLHFQSESRLILDELAFTAAYGGLGEACGAKLASLASLAFEGAPLIFATFSQYFNECLQRNRILKLT